ncbi:MAG: zinc ribbon domain-containing protein [Actinobacteria bacterium]|nr:zinc ribbon domain-containing protein [Actinomycetota bacterium]MBE3122638.1 zinc ribbon domain-containing protein [Thermoplasmata archaeon]
MVACTQCGQTIGIFSKQYFVGNKKYCETCIKSINKQEILEKMQLEESTKPEWNTTKDLSDIIKNGYVNLILLGSSQKVNPHRDGIKKIITNYLNSGEILKAITLPSEQRTGTLQLVFITNNRIIFFKEKFAEPNSANYTNIPLSEIIKDTIITKEHPKPNHNPLVYFKTKDSQFEIFNTPNKKLDDLLKELLEQKIEEVKQLTKPCPKCGAKNEPESVFCGECGLKFEEEMITRYCPECGEKNKLKNQFCEKCGTKLGGE